MTQALRQPLATLALLLGLGVWAVAAPPAPVGAAAEAAGAAGAAPQLSPAQRQQARELYRGLRCVVCEGQSIAESQADLARQMRRVVRQKLAAGATPDEIRSYMVERYGESVLWRPPFGPATLALWLGPFLVLLAGAGIIWAWFRRRRSALAAELAAEEPPATE